MNQDLRLSLIQLWLNELFQTDHYVITPASSDASFRRYFRVQLRQNTYIVMDAPPEHENIEPFIRIAEYLRSNNVNVPEILAKSDDGFVLLTDFGSLPFLTVLADKSSAETLYKQAMTEVIKIQKSTNDNFSLPVYDETLLQQEMDLFPEWFLTKHLGLESPSFLNSTFELLINNAEQQPQVLVHRDYHSRNLMYIDEGAPGVIDFQDAVIGPISYDLVSLLRDCYIEWPEEKIDQWLAFYLQTAKQKLLIDDITFAQFKRWFDLMGLQRHLKVLGIFCRLYYRDGKDNYLNDLPLTLRYVLDVASRYPEFSELVNYLQHPKVQAIL